MNKFENVDIFASLDAIMRQNTGFFQSDFDIDKEIIAKAAASPNREDLLSWKTYLQTQELANTLSEHITGVLFYLHWKKQKLL